MRFHDQIHVGPANIAGFDADLATVCEMADALAPEAGTLRTMRKSRGEVRAITRSRENSFLASAAMVVAMACLARIDEDLSRCRQLAAALDAKWTKTSDDNPRAGLARVIGRGAISSANARSTARAMDRLISERGAALRSLPFEEQRTEVALTLEGGLHAYLADTGVSGRKGPRLLGRLVGALRPGKPALAKLRLGDDGTVELLGLAQPYGQRGPVGIRPTAAIPRRAPSDYAAVARQTPSTRHGVADGKGLAPERPDALFRAWQGDIPGFLHATGHHPRDLAAAAAATGVTLSEEDLSSVLAGSTPVSDEVTALMAAMVLDSSRLDRLGELRSALDRRAFAAPSLEEILAERIAEFEAQVMPLSPNRILPESELTPAQLAIVDACEAWWKAMPTEPSRPPGYVARIDGFAGTGKSTIIGAVLRRLGLSLSDVLFCAPTGKAAAGMRQKGLDGARTIHALFLKLQDNGYASFEVDLAFEERLELEERPALIVVDEHSMVGWQLGQAITRHDIPVLALGDPYQLRPVEGSAFFGKFRPIGTLTEVHRQGRSSPILRASMAIRELAPLNERGEVRRVPAVRLLRSLAEHADEEHLRFVGAVSDHAGLSRHDVVLVHRNGTRHELNDRIRRELGHVDALPCKPGARIVIERNCPELDISNGQALELVSSGEVLTWKKVRQLALARSSHLAERAREKQGNRRLEERAAELAKAVQDFERHLGRVSDALADFAVDGVWRLLDDPQFPPFRGMVCSAGFISPPAVGEPSSYSRIANELRMLRADWGYALTVHKAQGSGFADVCVVEEDVDDPRWLYTAITRAAERLTVVVPDDHPYLLANDGWQPLGDRPVELGMIVKRNHFGRVVEGTVTNLGKGYDKVVTVRSALGHAKKIAMRNLIGSWGGTTLLKDETPKQRAVNLQLAASRNKERKSRSARESPEMT
ncbi:ATP-dependent RecD-like DNA helicase [Roseomonas sp. GCM10028921]